MIYFEEDEYMKPIKIIPVHDLVPEYEEKYSLILTNISGNVNDLV